MIRTLMILLMTTVTALAFHEHTFEVFELREHLLMLTINLWELLEQLEYAHPELRLRVYEEIQHLQGEIDRAIQRLLELDLQQHPLTK